MVPGRALHRLSQVLLPPQVCEQIIDAQLADFQHEWAASSNSLQRILILIRGYFAFCLLFGTCAVGIRDIGIGERRALRRVFAIAAAVSLLAVTYLTFGPLGLFQLLLHQSRPRRWHEWFYLLRYVHHILPIAVALGVVSGIAIGLQRQATRASSRVVILIAAASCVAVFVVTNWMLPWGIEAFRVIRVRTLGDLTQYVAIIERTKTNGPGTIRGAQLDYHLRWSWPFATVALGLFALSLHHRGRIVQIALGLASCRVYFYLMDKVVPDLVWTSRIPPMLLAWLPNLIFLVLAFTTMVFTLGLKTDTTKLEVEAITVRLPSA